MNHSLPNHGSRPACFAGFTLIELLVVISIIAILAGLAFPAVQGALGQGKKAQARNDVNQIAAAFKAYQLEYGRLPSGDTPETADGNAPANWINSLTETNATMNPRGIVFFEPRIAKGGKSGKDGAVYRDPWGGAYQVTLDYNYDNRIAANNQTNFTTVIVLSGGPDTNMTSTSDNISNIK